MPFHHRFIKRPTEHHPGCSSEIASTLGSAVNFSSCTSSLNGVDCTNPGSIIGYVGSTEHSILYPRPLQLASSCALCDATQGIAPECSRLLGDILAIISNQAIDLDAYDASDINQVVSDVSSFCSEDAVAVAYLRYQSSVVCASSISFGYDVTSYRTLDKAMDMRYITQCGTCGIMACLPGQLCRANEPPQTCPGGYYCPDAKEAILCPRGFYCPIGSALPIKCHPLAFSSCEEGSEREVLWAPLVWSFGLLISLYVITTCGPKRLLDALGYERQVKSSSSRPDFSRTESKSSKTKNLSEISVEISFDSVDLITNQVKRLDAVCGTIKSGKFTAIMGASGAGKTTLMNVLMGKENIDGGSIAYRDESSGKLLPKADLKSIVAFVPQDDVLLREMAVEQLIYQSAYWRLPVTMTSQEKDDFVEDVIRKIKLNAIRHIVVGGGESSLSGISPGDRKLVNIAVELVSKPACIFLDEPTTNLDASSALNVASIVSNLSGSGMTCIAVIHQPRKEIFALIDDLILLVPGGRVAYHGPAVKAVDYFAYIGFPLNVKSMNKADFVIDLTSGNFDGCSISAGPSGQPIDWHDLWLQKGEEFLRLHERDIKHIVSVQAADIMDNDAVALGGDTDLAPVSSVGQSAAYQPIKGEVIFEPKPGFVVQLLGFSIVAFLQEIKEHRLLFDCTTHLITRCIIGIACSGGALLLNPLPSTYSLSCPPEAYERCVFPLRYQLGPATFIVTALLGVVVVPSAVRTFGREIPVFRRNYDVGANPLAYFCGKSFVNMLLVAPKSVCFVAPILAIASWSAPFEYFFAICISLSLCIGGLAYVFSLLLWDPDVAILLSTIYVITINLLGGFVPLLGSGYHSYPFHARWAARAIATAELIYGRDFSEDLYDSLFDTPWKKPNFAVDIAVLMIMALFFNTLAYLLLWRKVGRR